MHLLKKYNRTIIGVLFIVLASFVIYNQEGEAFIHNLKVQLKKYNLRMPLEKAYMHTDKSFYKPSEVIWFKAYVLDGKTHEPASNSEIVYAELINPRGNIETKLTLPLINGGARGSFDISESMPGGIYKLRAYTNWMKNFGGKYAFEKEIQVQKVLLPRLLMKIDFEKEAYGAADEVGASLSVRTLEDKPLAGLEYNYKVSIAGSKIILQSGTTDKDGTATINFNLPGDLSSNDGILNVTMMYEGNTESISRSVPIVLNNIKLDFFPEGGELLKNYENRCAFKAVDEFGKPADIEGAIYDNNENEIATFSSYHQGMGVFSIVPMHGSYYAKITRPKGIDKRYYLPKVLKKGYLLNKKSRTKNTLTVKIVSPRNEELILIGQIRGNIVYSESINLEAGEQDIEINTSSFPGGIFQLTLFDSYEIARCERLFFVNPKSQMYVNITPSKKEFLPREKVELKIQTLDKDSLPIPATLSLAVVNDKVISFADDKQDNILSYLLVSSDLKGKIEEPSFYFDKEEEKADTALDYLLLTQGWRRFTWNEILGEKYSVNYFAEKATSVSGTIFESTGQPLRATVTLLEISGEQRAAQLQTRDDGKFLFRSVDPTAEKKLIVRAPGIDPDKINIQFDKPGYTPDIPHERAKATQELLPVIIKEKIIEESVEDGQEDFEEQEVIQEDFDAVLEPDLMSLDEVAIIGYGTQKSSSVTAAVTVVREERLNANSLEQALKGRIAGLEINDYAPGAGEARDIKIRGTGSIASDEPLFVVDGIPLNTFPDSKLSPIGHINAEDIESVCVLKDAEATAIYGAKGAAGVIVINTKKNSNERFRQKIKYPKKRHQITDIPTKTFSRVRQFYSPIYEQDKKVMERTDFRTTIYWNPDIHTDKNGEGSVSFYNSDEITTFRATAEGIGAKGLVGRGESTFFTQLPFTIETKIPPYLTYGDIVELPVIFKNNTGEEISGILKLVLPKSLQILEELPKNHTIAANNTKTLLVKCKVAPIQGKFMLQIGFNASGLKDAVQKEIEVQPKGFPSKASISSNELDKNYIVMVSDPLEGSLQAKFTAFPDVTSDLMSGIESILREPYGCFEQTSSSTYPNIMVLQYLEETGTVNPVLYKRALDLIDRGYKRLTSFETSTKGYEWFGSSPGHESLTAYGLLEFTDMQKVYKNVDEQMLKRTSNWIFNRRDGKGNFKLNSKALDQFGRASQQVVNAYVVYALSEAGFKNLDKEYETAYKEAIHSKDPYQVCLLAIASFNLNRPDNGKKLIDIMEQKLSNKDFSQLRVDHSITRSGGVSLQVETASLYLLTMLKSPEPKLLNMRKVSDFIIGSRCGGGFGSTQATILALKALTEFAKYSKHTQSNGTIELYINGKLAANRSYNKGHMGEIIIDSLESLIKAGANTIHVIFKETKDALPYSLDINWTSLTPNSNDQCAIDLETKISHTKVKVGETTRLSTTLSNVSHSGQPMSIALIGIPAGLSAQPWQLKELQEKNVFDYYEVRKNYVVIYYRDMKPDEEHLIHLDLKAEVPGIYTAPASTGYLYYTNEFKDWEAGSKIQVEMD